MMSDDSLGKGGIELCTMGASPTVNVEPARRRLVGLLETAREVGRGRESARHRDFRQRHSRVGHQRQGLFETPTLDEVGEGRSDEGLKDTMKMKRRERCGTRDVGQADRLVQMTDDVIDGAIDALEVCGRRRGASFFASSQDSASPRSATR